MRNNHEAFQTGYDDRVRGRSMRETWTIAVEFQNAYVNGYRAACEDAGE